MKDTDVADVGSGDPGSGAEGDKTQLARLREEKASDDTFSFGGKSIDFAELELRVDFQARNTMRRSIVLSIGATRMHSCRPDFESE